MTISSDVQRQFPPGQFNQNALESLRRTARFGRGVRKDSAG